MSMNQIIGAKRLPKNSKEWRKAMSRRVPLVGRAEPGHPEFGATVAPVEDASINDIPKREIIKMANFIYQMWTENPKVQRGERHVFVGNRVMPRDQYDAAEAFAATIRRAATKAGKETPEEIAQFLKDLINNEIRDHNLETDDPDQKMAPKTSTLPKKSLILSQP